MALTIETRELIIAAAEATAQAYVDAYGEPLDPATATDWARATWQQDRQDIPGYKEWTGGEYVDAWELYQATLVQATEDLCD
jgi:hypothetical protein